MFYFLVFLIGVSIGSFLNVLIDRLPNEQSIMGRSHCDHCKKDLKWYELLPILSYVFLGAKCTKCKNKLSFFYPLVEAITGIMFVWVIWRMSGLFQWKSLNDLEGLQNFGNSLLTLHNQTLMLLALLGIVCSAIVIFFSDLKYQIIPDSMQIALFGFSLLYIITQGVTPTVFLDRVLAAFVTMVPILLLFLLTKGRGMGFGDVKLAFMMGFLLGIMGGLTALYIGFISGALVGVVLIIFKMKKLRSKIAFGPFLVIGLLTVLFFDSQIFQIIRSLYRF